MANIILIGFMGAGKTTVGEILANELGYSFYDVDTFIEKTAGRSIKDMFTMAGESWFRDQETMTLSGLCDGDNRVIATGGGIVERDENFDIMHNAGTVIYLHGTIDKLWTRVAKDPQRPLATDLATFRARFDARKKKYEDWADIIVEAGASRVETIVEKIKEAL